MSPGDDVARDLVRYGIADGVAEIELNRPDSSNAVDLPTARALDAAVADAAADPRVRAVLVTGAGRRFCAGGDLSAVLAAADPAAYLESLVAALDGALHRLRALEVPVVGAVQGAVAGAGLAVLLSCDVVVAAPSTKFVMAYSGVGLTPDCGVSWLLPRAIGQQRALDLALTGRVLSAPEAEQWGLVNEVARSDGAAVRARALAREMSAGSASALGQAKRLLRASWDTTPVEASADEAQTITRAITTAEAQDLIRAFSRR
ncbi:enoyl-CoA hydratase [Micromonospora globispora]|uniref:enoyl-CoA hydratase/isomerase family protein n=1 Tax=Micromonospora globispora TaxID=1450148 RepID=UPI000D6FAB2A|nr:enoyl-CoA hydratase/isomerase family protein [Micromonospora globispora]PWU62266.1 enoyl-CoA hydratase [Micromonospora globispora]RQW98951.1 enoyl-CoA hydratase [Micromonospora globispora]